MAGKHHARAVSGMLAAVTCVAAVSLAPAAVAPAAATAARGHSLGAALASFAFPRPGGVLYADEAAPAERPRAASARLAPLVVLYDQYDNDAGNGSMSSNRSDSVTLDAKVADDFVIPAGQAWSITQVDVRGFPGGSPAQSNFNLFFYSDSGGLPGSELAARYSLAHTGTDPDYTILLGPPPVVLGPGTYWVAVEANMVGANWYWGLRSAQSSSPAAFQEAGAYGTGCNAPAWASRGTCTGTAAAPDQMFRLHGESAAIILYDPARAGTASPYPSSIEVTGRAGGATDVNVTLSGLGHTHPDDLDILLVGPTGMTTILMSDSCGDQDLSGVNLTFDDAATGTLQDTPPGGSPCTSGTFDPTNYEGYETWWNSGHAPQISVSLANFNGINPNGPWRLYVFDDGTAGSPGTISGGWSLTVTTPASPVTAFTNGSAITINDNSAPPAPAAPYPSTSVSGLSGSVSDVNLTLTGVSHTFPDNVDILLVGPTGANTVIMSDACGFADLVGLNLAFDDAAAAAPPDSPPSGACTSGTYKPSNYAGVGAAPEVFPAPAPTPSATVALANFNGTNPNGVWSLYVVNDLPFDGGSVAGWSLSITTGAPTAVGVRGLTAGRVGGAPVLVWRTGSEFELAGFNVYRRGAKLNRSLIRAKRPGSGSGAVYRFVDRSFLSPATATYRLELVRLDGSRVSAGTATLATGGVQR